jgi:hypothetical protein
VLFPYAAAPAPGRRPRAFYLHLPSLAVVHEHLADTGRGNETEAQREGAGVVMLPDSASIAVAVAGIEGAV